MTKVFTSPWFWLGIAFVIVWYAFGRKYQFISYCEKPRDGNDEWKAMSQKERTGNCQRMYNSFKEAMPLSPIAWY